MRRWLWLVSVIACALAIPAWAAPPSLQWPGDCRLGEDCWVVHYVDTDPGPAAQDFHCGTLTYNAHKGTDVGIRDRAAMFRPVPVLAAAAGVVAGLRDTAPDHPGDQASIKAAMDKGEECGNGVLVRHDDGWSTQYCHLKSGSIRVAKGQVVRAGTVLGHVGNSGAASFPHLHLTVRLNKTVIDPFTGLVIMGQGCEVRATGSLWSAAVQASLPVRDAPMLFGACFRSTAPRYDALLQDMGSPASLEAEGSGLVLWAVAYGLRTGDVLVFKITDPDGNIFASSRFEQPKTQIRWMRFSGRSNKNGILRLGIYQGLVEIIRSGGNGRPPLVIERRVSVELLE